MTRETLDKLIHEVAAELAGSCCGDGRAGAMGGAAAVLYVLAPNVKLFNDPYLRARVQREERRLREVEDAKFDAQEGAVPMTDSNLSNPRGR